MEEGAEEAMNPKDTRTEAVKAFDAAFKDWMATYKGPGLNGELLKDAFAAGYLAGKAKRP